MTAPAHSEAERQQRLDEIAQMLAVESLSEELIRERHACAAACSQEANDSNPKSGGTMSDGD